MCVCFDVVSIVKLQIDLNSICALYTRPEVLSWESLMPRFYFHLKSKQSRIPDEKGKDFDTLNEAYEHGRKLVDKILHHVGYDDANEWKVIVLNDEDDAQLVIPFSVSYQVGVKRAEAAGRNPV
jgi:Domain of unknown function (DUF6894)